MQEKIKNFLLELFFHSFCLGCQKEGSYLCDDCKATLEISEFNYRLCNNNPQRLPNDNNKCYGNFYHSREHMLPHCLWK